MKSSSKRPWSQLAARAPGFGRIVSLSLVGLLLLLQPALVQADASKRRAAKAKPASVETANAESTNPEAGNPEAGRSQWEARMQAPLRALHAAHRVLWLTTSVFHPFEERLPPSTQPEAILTRKPVPGELSSPFGEREDPVKHRRRKHHKGVDFVADRGTLVHAAGPGIVLRAQRSSSYGRIVIVDHGLGLQTRYAHLQSIKVKKGDFVPANTVIGTVGSSGRATGPHLHFEVRQDGVALPPDDVTKFKLPPCAHNARDCVRNDPKS